MKTYSYKDWLEKYYPTPADEATHTWLEAVEHSIRKWTGLSPSKLKKYHLKKDIKAIVSLDIRDSFSMFIADETCAMCQKDREEFECDTCPLYLVRGGVACGGKKASESKSPYLTFIDDGDTRPMLRWLRKAKQYIIDHKL